MHAVSRFHGCPSRTVEGAQVVVDRPREETHALRFGAMVADALATFYGGDP